MIILEQFNIGINLVTFHILFRISSGITKLQTKKMYQIDMSTEFSSKIMILSGLMYPELKDAFLLPHSLLCLAALFIYFWGAVVEFELRSSSLLSRHSTTSAISPAIFALFFLEIGSCFCSS
jgi:hypothetical protein